MVQVSLVICGELYSYAPFRLASGSEPTINVSGEAGHKIDYWLAIARQEKIVNLKGLSGYNPPRYTRETCAMFDALLTHTVWNYYFFFFCQ